MAGELLGSQLGAGEVGDPALGSRKARDPLAVHRLPDVAADLILGPHQVVEETDAIASGILERAPGAGQAGGPNPPQTRLRNPIGEGAGGRGSENSRAGGSPPSGARGG